MLTGLGDDYWMRKKYEDRRRKGLENRYAYDSAYLTKYGIEYPLGSGRTKDSTYQIKQFPFPTDQSIRQRKTIDIRKIPRLGID